MLWVWTCQGIADPQYQRSICSNRLIIVCRNMWSPCFCWASAVFSLAPSSLIHNYTTSLIHNCSSAALMHIRGRNILSCIYANLCVIILCTGDRVCFGHSASVLCCRCSSIILSPSSYLNVRLKAFISHHQKKTINTYDHKNFANY